MANVDIRALHHRLTEQRALLLRDYPFYGRLLLRLTFGFAECGTACTDMEHIIFDPAFGARLEDEALRFVLLHEVMHCVLHHCTRGKSLQPRLYNIACDIVVNSLILETMGREEIEVDGEKAMHRTPMGTEGRFHTAEQVYEMLLRKTEEDLDRYDSETVDSHDIWDQIRQGAGSDAWDQFVREAVQSAGTGTGIPYGLRRYLDQLRHNPRTNWRQLLQDFIRMDRSDFTWQVPDRRFQGDILLPSFQENLLGETVDRLWFLVDTSGSISAETLSEAYGEIRGAVEQIDALSGDISFFDTAVTEPLPFSSVPELEDISPVGGGGTSFHAIFNALPEFYPEELPRAVIILTDGYAGFPEETAALEVPVLWIIFDSEVEPPWGTVIHL